MQLPASNRFSGFAAGRTAVSLPAQFFAQLLPLIDDEAELRVTLAVLYATSVLKGSLRGVTAARLAADAALIGSLRHCGGSGVLLPALERAAARGAILVLALADDGLLCFANDAPGRRLVRTARGSARSPCPPASRSLLFRQLSPRHPPFRLLRCTSPKSERSPRLSPRPLRRHVSTTAKKP